MIFKLALYAFLLISFLDTLLIWAVCRAAAREILQAVKHGA